MISVLAQKGKSALPQHCFMKRETTLTKSRNPVLLEVFNLAFITATQGTLLGMTLTCELCVFLTLDLNCCTFVTWSITLLPDANPNTHSV